MKKLIGGMLVAGCGLVHADVANDLWFYANFDAPTFLDGAVVEKGPSADAIVEGRFGRGACLGGERAWDEGRFYRFSDEDLMRRFPLANGTFSCWYLATNSTSRTAASPGFCVGPYSRRHFGFNGGSDFSLANAQTPSFRLKRAPGRADRWRHFAITWTPTSVVAYLDGAEVGRFEGQLERAIDYSQPGAFWIGSFADRTKSPDTKLDELAIFSRTLTEVEVQALAKAVTPLVVEPKVCLSEFAYSVFYRNQTNAALCARLYSPVAAEYDVKATVGGTARAESVLCRVPAGWSNLTVTLPDLAAFRPGTYPYEVVVRSGTSGTGRTSKTGEIVFARRGELLVRPRLERDQVKVLSWGGFKPISHDFLELIGANAVNYVHADKFAALERDALRRGLMLSARDVDYKKFLADDLDETRIRARFRRDWQNLRGTWGWTMSLMNSEVFGSKTFPVWKCAESPAWRALAEKAVGGPLPENMDKIYVNEPHQVNWKALGKTQPTGIVADGQAEVDLLLWLHRDGCPVLIGNDFHTREIKAMDPGIQTWSEPVIETTGLARHHDMVADWLYDYETSVNIKNLKDQYAWARAYGKPYMPTLSPGYWHCRRRGFWRGHPTAKNEKGKAIDYMMTQTAEEMMIRTWLCFGAVPSHDLSLFALDGWERGAKAGKTLVNDCWGLTEGTPVCHPDDPVKYGRFLKETFLPAAELLRDMPNVRPDVALCPLLENRPMTRGWGAYTTAYSFETILAEVPGNIDYDVLVDPEFSLENLSRYRAVIVPYACVMTRSHHDVLAKLPKTTTLVLDEECPTNVLPSAVHLAKDGFRKWSVENLSAYAALRPARSDQDAANGDSSFTFWKEHAGANYAVVVNDRRDRGGCLQENYQTNVWYRPHALPQRIVTRLRVPETSAIYDFASGGRRLTPRYENGCAVIERDFAAGEGTVYSVYPKALAAPSVEMRGPCRAGDRGALSVVVRDADGVLAAGRQVVSVTVRGTNGAPRDESGRYTVEGGRVTIPLRFAADEESGTWTVSVKELTTGLQAKTAFKLEGR